LVVDMAREFELDLIDFCKLRKRDPFGVLMHWILTLKDHATALVYLRSLPRKRAVILSDCFVGIEPCECKGKGHRWIGNQVFRCLESRKEKRSKRRSEISARDLQKPVAEFKIINSLLMTKYCSHQKEIL
jgi:hypothetical protein